MDISKLCCSTPVSKTTVSKHTTELEDNVNFAIENDLISFNESQKNNQKNHFPPGNQLCVHLNGSRFRAECRGIFPWKKKCHSSKKVEKTQLKATDVRLKSISYSSVMFSQFSPLWTSFVLFAIGTTEHDAKHWRISTKHIFPSRMCDVTWKQREFALLAHTSTKHLHTVCCPSFSSLRHQQISLNVSLQSI